MTAGGSGPAGVTGVVIGKFYPPHRGHRHLIDTAEAAVDHLTVIVVERPGERPAGALRRRWLAENHPDATVLLVPDFGRDDDSAAWAAFTVALLGGPPDVAFTSEDYGAAWAAHMGARHVLVDRARRTVPVSGTAVRADPLGNWAHLEPNARAHYARRVCVVGAESTGTTTLAAALARHYRTTWVPEYGRLYAEGKFTAGDRSPWRSGEFAFIADQQNRLEDQLARNCDRLLVCDTDALATCLWHERYLGTWSAEVEALTAGRGPDLYLLTTPEIPFVQDGLRDGEHVRHAMHQRFAEELARRALPHLVVGGADLAARLATAVAACDALLAAPPR